MERHVDLLGILARLLGALAMLVGVSMLLLAAGAMVQAFDAVGNSGLAAGLTAGILMLVGIFGLVWGGAHLWAARLLRKRLPLGRVLMLGLGVIDLLALPFGTALGVYAFWVLLTNAGRHLFEPVPAGSAPAR